jgi:hypothetical protein
MIMIMVWGKGGALCPNSSPKSTHLSAYGPYSYYGWVSFFYFFCVLSLLLPILIGFRAFGEKGTRIAAFATAVAVALLNWSNLGTVAGNFDQARTDLRLAKLNFPNDEGGKLRAAYADAEKLVRVFSPGVPKTTTTKD